MPVLVVTEVAYLLASRVGAETEVRFLGDLAAGELVPEPVAPMDWLRIAELVAAYRDLPLGTVDASIVAAAERHDASTIATLDRGTSRSFVPPTSQVSIFCPSYPVPLSSLRRLRRGRSSPCAPDHPRPPLVRPGPCRLTFALVHRRARTRSRAWMIGGTGARPAATQPTERT